MKKLQAEGLPIRATRGLVTGKTEQQLKRLFGVENGRASGPAPGGGGRRRHSVVPFRSINLSR